MTVRPSVAAVGLATAAGLAWWASHPPLHWWPATYLVVPLVLTALAVDRDPSRGPRGARLGLTAGLAAFAPMLTWLILSAGFLGWMLLSLVQAGFVALAAVVLARCLDHRWLPVIVPIWWTGVEVWRNSVPLGGFGWGEFAYAHVTGSWLAPLARIAGGHAITLTVVAIGTLAFVIIRGAVRGSGSLPERILADGRSVRGPTAGLAAVLLLSVVATIEPPAAAGSLDVLVVQGNDIEDWIGGLAEEDAAVAERMLATTEAALADAAPADLTVWPESSVDRDPFTDRGADLLPVVERAAAVTGGNLLVGVNATGRDPDTFANSAILLDAAAAPTDRYVKRHLVPFGEYIPFRPLLGDLPPLQRISRDGVPGADPQVVEIGEGVRAAVVICFETLFPELVRSNLLATSGGPAELLVATTNDASFGRSSEPAQHLAQSQLRALETGRWVVHAAVSGSSAFVDPDGTVHDATPLFTRTAIRRDVPLVTGYTPFLRTGDIVGTLARLAAVALLAVLLVRRFVGRGAGRAGHDG